jgi:sigma-B regulation protein RsbU (phosphoserine phosphatase)
MPLGVKESKRTREIVELNLSQNETLFCYTDALIEGQSPGNEMYGHDRLYSELKNRQNLSSGELVKFIQSGWKLFLEGQPQEDDLTIMAIKNVQLKDRI